MLYSWKKVGLRSSAFSILFFWIFIFVYSFLCVEFWKLLVWHKSAPGCENTYILEYPHSCCIQQKKSTQRGTCSYRFQSLLQKIIDTTESVQVHIGNQHTFKCMWLTLKMIIVFRRGLWVFYRVELTWGQSLVFCTAVNFLLSGSSF